MLTVRLAASCRYDVRRRHAKGVRESGGRAATGSEFGQPWLCWGAFSPIPRQPPSHPALPNSGGRSFPPRHHIYTCLCGISLPILTLQGVQLRERDGVCRLGPSCWPGIRKHTTAVCSMLILLAGASRRPPMLPDEVSYFAVTWTFIARSKHQHHRTSSLELAAPASRLRRPHYTPRTARTT